MKYRNLKELISSSSSSREYFLSQSVPMQIMLHEYDDCIHSAFDLHLYVHAIEKYDRAVEISETFF